MERSDGELLDAWGSGDAAAGSELFDRYFDALFRFFRNKAGDAAEDLIQETMLACVAARSQFRNAASFRTYVFTIARNTLYARFRAQRRRGVESDVGALSVADLGTSPSGLVARRQDHDLLLRALRAVPLDLQVVLELHFWEDLTGPEIAEILSVPEGTVRSRVRRAKEALSAKLAELSTIGDERALAQSQADLDGWARAVRAGIDAEG